jgi:hypothetical protein
MPLLQMRAASWCLEKGANGERRWEGVPVNIFSYAQFCAIITSMFAIDQVSGFNSWKTVKKSLWDKPTNPGERFDKMVAQKQTCVAVMLS